MIEAVTPGSPRDQAPFFDNCFPKTETKSTMALT